MNLAMYMGLATSCIKASLNVTTIFVTDSDSFQLKIVHVLESSTQATVTRHT